MTQSIEIPPKKKSDGHRVYRDPCKIGAPQNDIKDAIENNDPIEDHLHVIAVISNVCRFNKRVKLMNEFLHRMQFENHVIVYIVELAYGDQPFTVASHDNPRHLQLRTTHAIWHKENMINLGVKKLLPPDWKAFAWIDADIEFENHTWALETLKILNGAKDIVQIFSHAIDMDAKEQTMNVYNSFAFQYSRRLPYSHQFPNYWHPGYAWACTRKAYEKMGGLFQWGILGASDHIMSFCLTHKGLQSINERYSPEFKEKITEFEHAVKRLRLGYVPGVIRHFFHGSKVNRKYIERNEILLRHNYRPDVHVTTDEQGVLVPTPEFSPVFLNDILDYFKQRNEDE
jgi:hypothetical protein